MASRPQAPAQGSGSTASISALAEDSLALSPVNLPGLPLSLSRYLWVHPISPAARSLPRPPFLCIHPDVLGCPPISNLSSSCPKSDSFYPLPAASGRSQPSPGHLQPPWALLQLHPEGPPCADAPCLGCPTSVELSSAASSTSQLSLGGSSALAPDVLLPASPVRQNSRAELLCPAQQTQLISVGESVPLSLRGRVK